MGIAIAAVVCGHVLREVVDAGFMQDDTIGHLLLALRYACSTIGFPVLFFVFGLEASASLRQSRLGFLRMTVRTIVYPFVLWSVLQTLVQWVLAILADRPFPLGELVRIAWRPAGQFWFLYALCVCHLLALVAIRPDSGVADNRGRLAADALPGALAVPCAALAMMTLWGVATMTFLGIAFSMMGAVMARGAARGIGARARVSVILALAVVFLGAIGIGRRFGGYQNVYAWPANVAGAALVAAAAQWLGPKHFAHGVAWLGRGWKPVFVLYVMAASLVWTAPLSAGITLDIVHVIFGALAGIGLPLLLYFIAQRFRLARFAGFCEEPGPRESRGSARRRVRARPASEIALAGSVAWHARGEGHRRLHRRSRARVVRALSEHVRRKPHSWFCRRQAWAVAASSSPGSG